MPNITIIGTGYVGLVTGVCLAELGFSVVCHDIDPQKIRRLKKGRVPFYEPDLEGLLTKNITESRLIFSLNLEEALWGAEVVFICVGTPPKRNGSADLRAYFQVVKGIARFLRKKEINNTELDPFIVVNKSTVPIGTAQEADQIMRSLVPNVNLALVANPEFLREGRAVADFMAPERIVLGFGGTNISSFIWVDKFRSKNNLLWQQLNRSQQVMLELYSSFSCPSLLAQWETAEMVKYASNAFLATKISFINEIASMCDKVGADVKIVAQGMGYDSRIGDKFLRAGIGYGGSCFPKDVRALHYMALHQDYNFRLLKAVVEVNNQQRQLAVLKIKAALGGQVKDKLVGVLGLAFKPETDDTRESASLFIIKELIKQGARVRAYDPEAAARARQDLTPWPNVQITKSALAAIKKCDLIFLATEWAEFISLDWAQVKSLMKGDRLVDGRNVLDRVKLENLGFKYYGFGTR